MTKNRLWAPNCKNIEISNIPRQEHRIITEENAIIVPISDKEEKGFFGRLFDKINPLDDE